MLISEVMECDINSWYEKYKSLTFPTTFIPIPKDVLEYLRIDSTLVLPSECDADGYFDQSADDSDSEEDDFEDDDSESAHQPSFPEFSQSLKDVLSKNNKKKGVFVKLNWSSPRDAIWVLSSSLQCSSLTDIYLLLKSSQFIHHDLSNPFKDCDAPADEKESSLKDVQFHLALRDWRSINPGHEFRCFVKGRTLVGVSQRDPTSFYDYILKEENDILEDVQSFLTQHLSDFSLDNFVFDIVRSCKKHITLVDFNPWGRTTDSLLYEWDELNEGAVSELSLRFIREEKGIRSDSLRMYSLPTDVIDIANGTDHDKLISFLELQAEMQNKMTK